jgi:hypothetical protein
MNRVFGFSAALVLSAASAATAQDAYVPRYVTVDSTAFAEYSLDLNSISADDGFTRRYVEALTGTSGGMVTFRYVEADCVDKTRQVLAFRIFSPDGRLIGESGEPDIIEATQPGDAWRTVLDRACSINPQQF